MPLRFSNSRFMPSTVNESASHLSTSMSSGGGCCFSLIILSFLSLYVYVKPLKRLFSRLRDHAHSKVKSTTSCREPDIHPEGAEKISSLSLAVAPAPAPRHHIQYNL